MLWEMNSPSKNTGAAPGSGAVPQHRGRWIWFEDVDEMDDANVNQETWRFSSSRSMLRVHDKKAVEKDYKLFSLREESQVNFYDAWKTSGE